MTGISGTARLVGLALGLLAACGSDSDELPDLALTVVRELHCPGACAPLRLEVCLENRGEAEASNFLVTVNEQDSASVDGLAAGAQTCASVAYTFSGVVGQPNVIVDALDEVAESDESNNTLNFPPPGGTRCDVICFNKTAPTVPTPAPSA